MAKINILPKSVAELIAAGEVVERPMSVVKELVENSIDAGADNIAVEIKNGGIKYIRVTDNGCGMEKEDVPSAFISHATSKIKDASDLNAILTLGFRGEALPSVAAVSRLSLLTKTADSENGVSFTVEGGEVIGSEEAGCPTGTTIIVRDLFYNTPARMKFLKRDATEGTYVADAVIKEALSYPEIRFTLIRDGKKVLSTPGSGDLYSAVYAIFGKETAQALIKCEHEEGQIRVSGYISRPLNNRPNRNMQFFFVNRRCVRIPAAAPALDEAYKNSIMVGKFPMCFLALEMPADKTDVNVHPAKTEIRFAEETKLFETIFYAARSALARGDDERPSIKLPPKEALTAPPRPVGTQMRFETKNDKPVSGAFTDIKIAADKPLVLHDSSYKDKNTESIPSGGLSELRKPLYEKRGISGIDIAVDDVSAEKEDPREPFGAAADEDAFVKKEETEKPFKAFTVTETPIPAVSFGEKKDAAEPPEPEPVKIIGEAFSTYIIAERGAKLLLIDKHAAHERMIFNTMTSGLKKQGSQLLLAPVSVTLSPAEYAVVNENIHVFSEAGFGIEDFGSGTVMVRECPVELTKTDIADIITEMAGKLLKGSARPMPEKLDWLYHSTACRAAIKAGDELKPEETESFVKRLLADESIKYCPHGRPVMYELTKHEIEKQFGRLG